jgi:hypothetical protein
MIKFEDLLAITGVGTKVKIGYERKNGFFYKGELKDAPQIEADTEVANMYIFPGEDALTIVLN